MRSSLVVAANTTVLLLLACSSHGAAHILPPYTPALHPLPEPPTRLRRAHHDIDTQHGSSLPPRASVGHNTTAARTEAALAAMNSFYNQTAGQWTVTDAWWLSGVALTNLADYMYKTGSRAFMAQAQHTIDQQIAPVPWWPQGGGYFRADSTDDTGWWALAMVRMFDLGGNQTYLDIARLDEAYMYQYWTMSDCAGGLFVDIRARTYKNAIANELYMLLAASLHRRVPGDTAYLAKAVATWDWFAASGMLNSQNLVNDGLAETAEEVCFNNQLPTWSYNQGVILGALTELYRATQNQTYITTARAIADAVLASASLTQNGTLTDPCEAADACNNDQQIFKGIFARNLADLNGVLSDGPYAAYLQRNADTAFRRDRNATDFYDVRWAGPFRNSTIAKQASAYIPCIVYCVYIFGMSSLPIVSCSVVVVMIRMMSIEKTRQTPTAAT
ncbi:glycoside hydrolase family 76 protein [Podospora appendiculata]|uniref:Glycoside hydrolase family 76 protein n=1 Tax=Podospora appendiculata TaxID=314037 RepID=A0AAE0XFQ8_9PEZI|nr:glycoside hydrolase family 76 protein [Podospora appendiculata]